MGDSMHWYDLTELLPPVFRNIKSMLSAAWSENKELLKFKAVLGEIKDNFFIQTCDVQTLQYWESLLNIRVYAGETIEDRRQEIIRRLMNNQPITLKYVRKVMNDMFGEGNYEILISENNPFVIYFSIFNSPIEKVEQFLLWFEEVCPAHIQWNAGHTDKSKEHNGIYLGAQSDYMSYAVLEEPPAPPEPEYIDILLALYMSGGVPRTVSGFYSSGSWYNSGIMSSEDKARLNDFGIQDVNTDSDYPYGKVGWNNNYTYEPLAIYKDAAGAQLITENMSHWNFHCSREVSGGQADECSIVCGASFGFYPECKTWKCRIAKIS